jgi:iron complex outermembrane receptor protein
MTNRYSVVVAIGVLICCSQEPAYSLDADQDSTGASPILEEVTVTARKREERDIDVPVTVQAFSGDQLENKQVVNVTDLYATVPNLYFSANSLSPGRDLENLVIRGVGAESAGQPAVATIIDGVYQPGLAFDSDFLDASSVEVLKGPQSTIFGRNAEAGALNITLKKPDATTHESASVTVDNFNTQKVQGSVSGALTDDFFGSIAASDMHTDGYLTDPTLNGISADRNSRWEGRLALRYKPSDQLDINWSIDSNETKGLTGEPGVPLGAGNYEVLNDFLIDAHSSTLGTVLNVEYNFGDMTFNSITGARKLTNIDPYDFSGGPVGGIDYPGELMDLHEYQSILSQEFRLNGKAVDSRLHWLAGVYVFQDKNTLLRRLLLPFLPAFGTSYDSYKQDQYLTNKGYAIFADATFDITEKLSLDVGERYGYEKVNSDFYQYAVIPDIITINSGATPETSTSYNTPSASLLYHITADSSVYFRYAQGVRGGGFPLAPTPDSDIAYKPEQTKNYELGAKGRVFNGTFGYDLSVFDISITDQQVDSVVYVNGDHNIPVAAISNAGKSRSRGAEANFEFHALDALTLSANAGYTDARYVTYIDADGINRSGESIPFVPRFTVDAAAGYTLNAFGKPLTVGGDFQHVSPILSGSGIDLDIQFHIPSYNLTNFQATLGITDRFKVDVFVKNALDKYIYTKAFNSFFFIEPRPFATVLPPRNEGVRLSYKF